METPEKSVTAPSFIVGIRRNEATLIVLAEWIRDQQDLDVIVLARFETARDAYDWRDEQQARCDEINRRHCATCE